MGWKVKPMKKIFKLSVLPVVFATLLCVGLVWGIGKAQADSNPNDAGQTSPLHPTFALLDESGGNVLDSGGPVSAQETCGSCHDTEFITSHTVHAGLGTDAFPAPGQPADGKQAEVEMNCFLCHTPNPNNEARKAVLASAEPAWASTATLLGSGIVEADGTEFRYPPEAFSTDKELAEELVGIQDPTNANCGQCHGMVHTALEEPFVLTGDSNSAQEDWRGFTSGQVISPQKLSQSGMNLAGKENLERPFDVHAERNLGCTNCHYSANNPVYYQEGADTRPAHLDFDPRRLELGVYLKQPSHQFAASPNASSGEKASMRRCESCHSLETTHSWLPYKSLHMRATSCETCHIPRLYSPAFEQVDWTVLTSSGEPRLTLRGQEADGLITGYQPIILPRTSGGSQGKIAPFNLVSSWYWTSGEGGEPLDVETLRAAWLEGEGYQPQILAALDEDGSGTLEETELVLNSMEKVQAVAARLSAVGVADPRIAGEVQSHKVNHSVAAGDWAVKDCQICHSSSSRLDVPFEVAAYLPGGSLPQFETDADASLDGELVQEPDGRLTYRPATTDSSLYVLGNSAVGAIDLFGGLVFLGVLLGVASHGTLRFLTSMRHPPSNGELKKVYMYGIYERFWHWLQTFTILGLLFTGLVIHKPDSFGIFSFRSVVLVHNVLAVIVIFNAALSLFYHLASGEIRQYLPRPAGFFDAAIQQALFYLRGIFKGERHPFEKTPDQKLNPLQQITYFGLLNVLLPLQVITGALMWVAQHWPALTASLGGLPFLAPFHTLIAWLFAAFIVGHVYLTTTGHTPFASIQAMMMGWDELETPVPAEEGTD
jgi:thiosulfate reductase cytochrome b subunit